MTQPTGTAVVGTGYWGPAIVRNLAGIPAANLLHLVDLDTAKVESVGRKLAPRAQAHSDLDRMLADPAVTAVVIATPVRSHFPLASACLRAGKHCLVEKPLAMTVAECRALEEMAGERDLTLMVGHVFRFNAAVKQVKTYIDDGTLGDVLYVHSRRVNLGRVQADVNALWSFAPHDLSILDHWFGSRPLTVQARGFSYISEGVEDVVFATVTYPDNKNAHLHIGWLDPRKVREMTVVGNRRMVVFDDVAAQAKIRLYDSTITPMGSRAPETFAEWQVDIRHGDVTIPRLQWTEPLRAEMEHFLACTRGETECIVPGADGTSVTAAIVAAQTSLARGGAVVDMAEILST
jgi:predicted dehydrogenase